MLTNIICFNRHLCQLLTAEDIFKSFSQIIVDEPDVGFACKIVQTLNTILLTSTELFELRTQLKNLETQVRIKGGYMLYASVLLKYVFQGGKIFCFYDDIKCQFHNYFSKTLTSVMYAVTGLRRGTVVSYLISKVFTLLSLY